MRVVLTWSELATAAMVGIIRHIAALKAGKHNANGAGDDSSWNYHIEGACGEMAVAKALGVFWNSSVNTYRSGGDVGQYQVRCRSRSDYQLIIRSNDDPHSAFVLVRGVAPEYRVVGWMLASDAQERQDWLRDHGNRGHPAFFVPDSELRDLSTLRGANGVR